ncbi:MAG TPA: hypothetical protein VF468_18015, partial [Actinomycetota bacterium]|nr:hypothetical protein [Actinomycetota bacterium]
MCDLEDYFFFLEVARLVVFRAVARFLGRRAAVVFFRRLVDFLRAVVLLAVVRFRDVVFRLAVDFFRPVDFRAVDFLRPVDFRAAVFRRAVVRFRAVVFLAVVFLLRAGAFFR